MIRIFLTLAVLDFFALVACFVTGFILQAQEWAGSLYLAHFHLGLYATIGNLAVHCLIFIYFLGTGRWVKEVARAYKLPDVPWPRLTRELKRHTFPPALFAMLVPIAATASGLGVQMREWPGLTHIVLATGSLAVNLWAFRVEYRNLRTNAGVIEEVLREVDRIRAERGLPSNAEALRQED